MYNLHIYFGSPGPNGTYVKGIVLDPEDYTEKYRFGNIFYGYNKKDIIIIIKNKCKDALNVKKFHTKIF